jgi:ribosome-binding factor A
MNSVIRMELAQRIRFRFVPKIVFYLDESGDYAEKIENLLKQIKENDREKKF